MRIRLLALALSLMTALPACAAEQETAAQRDLTVTGPRQELERFVALQGSHSPPLATSAVTPLDNGRATAVVTLPAGFGGQQLVQITREALAAGLSYEYADAGAGRMRRR